MKKRVFIVIFVFIVSTNLTSKLSAKNSEIKENNNIFVSDLKIPVTLGKVKFTKKDLKKEIKERKKYHKILLEKYNNNFEKKYFDLISENSLILSNLRKEFKK